MHSINQWNFSLYSPDVLHPLYISGHGHKIRIELYDTTAKVEEITAYSFHPDRTTVWKRIVNWFVELFQGRTAVLVHVEGESSPLYVRVNHLSRILQIAPDKILKEAHKEDVTDFLIKHQIEQTAKKIKRLAAKQGILWTLREQQSIEKIIRKVGYRNVFKSVECAEFNSVSMALTLVELGKGLTQSKPMTSDAIESDLYEFSFSDMTITSIDNLKKKTLHLHDFTIKEEDVSEQTVSLIRELVQEKVKWTLTHQLSIEEVIKLVGHQRTQDLLDCKLFSQERMAYTLIEIGKCLSKLPPADPLHKWSYEFSIHLPHISIWKIENHKKTIIDSKNLSVTVEEFSKPLMTDIDVPLSSQEFLQPRFHSFVEMNKLTKGLKNSSNDQKLIEFQNLSQDLQSLSLKNKRYLTSLATRVGYSNLVTVLDRLTTDKKLIMFNTFIDIGRQLTVPTFLDGFFNQFRLKYIGKQKVNRQQITYAFAINRKEIFIAQDKIGEGNFKIVYDAIKLNDLNDSYVRVKIKEENEEGKSDHCNYQNSVAVKEVRIEGQFIEMLNKHKNEEGYDCIVVPFACEIMRCAEGKKTSIFFHKKYNGGDGNKLKKSSLFQKIHAIRDVAKGLAFIHRLHFVHMDMKPGNFLIDGDLDGSLPVKGKVCDFGLTVENGKELPGGSMAYLPPECLVISAGEPSYNDTCLVNSKIDSFAFGITMLEVLNDKKPRYLFAALEQEEIEDEILHMSQQSSSSKKEAAARKALRQVISQLIRREPNERLSCAGAAVQLERIIQIYFSS